MANHDSAVEIGLVVLGASQFEISSLEPNLAFARSKDAFVAAMMGAGGSSERLIDLFDSPKSVPDMIGQIENFLKHNRSLTDVIIYYCGHGGISGANELYLTLRKTREHWEDYEAITLGPLRKRLRERLVGRRVYLILDCCYAGRAAAQWMNVGGINPAIGGSVFGAFPKSGSALIAATQADKPAICLHDAEQTVFTGALVRILRNGIQGGASRLSLREIFDHAQDLIVSEHAREAPRPELYPFASDHSDIANTPIFANAATNRKPRPVPPPSRRVEVPFAPSHEAAPVAHRPDRSPGPSTPASTIKRMLPVSLGILLAVVAAGFVAFQYTSHVAIEQSLQTQEARKKLTVSLEQLDALTAATRSNADSAAACTKLLANGIGLAETIRQAAPADYARASTSIQNCRSMLAGSDERTSEIRAAAAALNMGFPPSVERLAKARNALTRFDLDRLSTTEKNDLTSAGDRAVNIIDQSDKRVNALLDADRAASRNRTVATLRALMESAPNLTSFDTGRSTSGISEALANAKNASSDFANSKARWSTLDAAVSKAGRERIEYYWPALNSAVNALTSLDRELASPQQNALLSQAQRLLNAAPPVNVQIPPPTLSLPRELDRDFGTIPGKR